MAIALGREVWPISSRDATAACGSSGTTAALSLSCCSTAVGALASTHTFNRPCPLCKAAKAKRASGSVASVQCVATPATSPEKRLLGRGTVAANCAARVPAALKRAGAVAPVFKALSMLAMLVRRLSGEGLARRSCSEPTTSHSLTAGWPVVAAVETRVAVSRACK
jgi:hypothetical protein